MGRRGASGPADPALATADVVLSCVPVRTGGGRTVALVTADAILSDPALRSRVAVVARRSLVDQMHPRARGAVIAVSDHRIVAELQLRRLARSGPASWWVSILGPPPLLTGRRTATVCAYAQLFHPEVDVAPGVGPIRRLARRAVNRVRLLAVARSDVVFFETPLLERRAAAQLERRVGRRSLRTLPPSCDPGLQVRLEQATRRAPRDRYRVLLFSAAAPHKGWSILPAVADELASRRVAVEFVLASSGGRRTRPEITEIGEVPHARRTDVLADVDALMLLSRLESFSNNCHEAWTAGIPLIVSDHEWSRGALGDAAIYVERDSVTSIADAIEASMDDAVRRRIRARGNEQLCRMPSPTERIAGMCHELGVDVAPARSPAERIEVHHPLGAAT